MDFTIDITVQETGEEEFETLANRDTTDLKEEERKGVVGLKGPQNLAKVEDLACQKNSTLKVILITIEYFLRYFA